MRMRTLATIVFAVIAACSVTACSSTNDGRTGLRGEVCALGYCLSPQVMTASSVSVPETTVVSGPVVAPATVLSQPAVLEHTQTVTSFQNVNAPPPQIAYAPPPAPPQLSK